MGLLGYHPFITELFYSFQTKQSLYFVLEYLPYGSIWDQMKFVNSFPEETIKIYSAEILLGLEVLHLNDYVYSDLKLENIFIDKEGN